MTELSPLVAYHVGPYTLFPEMRLLRGPRGEETINGQKFATLERLMRTPGKLVTRAHLSAAIWNGMDEPVSSENIVKIRVLHVRNALERLGEGGRKFVRLIWGEGYIMAEPAAAFEAISLAMAKPGEAFLSGAHP